MPQVEEPAEHVAPTEAMSGALHKLAELRAYAQQYFAAKTDLLKVTARKIAILAVLGIVGLIAAGATLVIALVLFLNGLAELISAAAGGRAWVGDLCIGFLVLATIAFGVMVGLGMLKKSMMKATVKKYDLVDKQQRDTFGQSSRDRTAAAGSVEIGN